MTSRIIPHTVLALILALGACRKSQTAAAAGTAAKPAGGAITLWTDSTELFMEHPALIVGEAEKFAVHLTDLSDFEPLRSGRITLTFTPRAGGPPLVVVQDTPRSPGIYGPAPKFERAGVYDLMITVESPQARDQLRVPGLIVFASADAAPRENSMAPPGIAFLKEQQWKTPGFRSAFGTRGVVSEGLAANGEVLPAAGRYAQVAAPISGLVEVSDNVTAPAPGQRVTRGQILAVLTPTVSEGGSSYAQARGAYREAEDEYARAKRLYEVEAVPQRRVHEAEIRLQTAREALAGLSNGGAMSANGKLVVRAPISGVISERSMVPGGRAEAGAPLFTIVDPSLVWIKVNVPAERAGLVSGTTGAAFRIPGAQRTYSTRRVVSIASVIDPATRTLPVIYEVSNDGTIKIGSMVSIDVNTGRRVEGIVIPESAVLDEDGRPIAYVQAEGERFEKRDLQLGGTESGRVLVSGGIKEGERVVTGAAYQVRLASLSTAVPAHGHEH